MTPIKNFVQIKKTWFFRPFFCGLLGLLFADSVRAADPIYQNLNNVSYYSPGTPVPPVIDATNFDNESLFSINFTTFSLTPQTTLYRTFDTLNFTNGENGIMTVNSPTVTNGFIVTTTVGFKFDNDNTASSVESMAGSFYNQGDIRCDSAIDGNNIFGGINILNLTGFSAFFLTSFGQCLISATNITNPGNIDMGVDGLLQMSGKTVDLSRGVFNMEGLLNVSQGLFGAQILDTVNFSSTGAFGTNALGWDPGVELGPNFAISSFPDNLLLTNSTSYFDIRQNGPSNIVIRAVFVQNNSPNVPYNVYIDNPNTIDLGLEPGAAHVEWVGAYTDPATGNSTTNYLYLTDNYALGASTNVFINGGVPDNFSFITSPDRLLFNPVNAGFANVFPDENLTNVYVYMNGQIIATTVGTNVTTTNPHGGVTNMPGRVVISADKELNLQNAIITGQNYLSLTATNQFDGSAGALIASPFSDINLAVTNGALNLTNLLESGIPNWSGTIQAWSTRWIQVDPVSGFTNDYRVLLVGSQLSPITVPWVQNLKLHTGKSMVISDVLNVYGSLFLDAQNLTITTNGIGFGSTSIDGELNSYVAGSVGPAQWPNLQYLTNSGAIHSQNLIILTNNLAYVTNNGVITTNNCGSVINYGLITSQGTAISTTNFQNSGTISNGLGNFTLRSLSATMTNGYVYCGGNISITANSLVTSNVLFQCLSLTLNPTNYLTDSGVSNGNLWVVGRTNGVGGSGFALLNNPNNGDLLGTTITNVAPFPNKLVANTWAGRDFGVSNSGYTNNAALGRLILDVVGNNSLITFTGTGTSNALYVDSLEFRDTLTNGINNNFDFTNWLTLNTNIVIYFAQAYINGISVAEKINNASVGSGKNGGIVSNGVVLKPGRLRWVPTYAGNFSSTNFVDSGITNTVNTALAQSQDIDSNGNGIANASDPSPFFTSQQINFTLTVTNLPTRQALLTWDTVPFATNYVYYTSLLLTNKWSLYTNFISTNVTGPVYPVTVSDTNVLSGIRFYKVLVQPWLTYPY